MSQGAVRLDAPLLTLDALMTSPPPSTFFRTTLVDDAMAPEYARGIEVLWSTTRTPKIGRLVLVRDQHGRLHVRQYREGREPGTWLAAALHLAYLTLHSRDDGLTVLAVLKGVLEPDD